MTFLAIYLVSVSLNAFFLAYILETGIPLPDLLRGDPYNKVFVFAPFLNTIFLAIMMIMVVAAVAMDPYGFFRGGVSADEDEDDEEDIFWKEDEDVCLLYESGCACDCDICSERTTQEKD